MVVETLNGMQDGLGGGGFPSFEEGSYMIGATGRQLHPRASVQFQVSLLTVGGFSTRTTCVFEGVE